MEAGQIIRSDVDSAVNYLDVLSVIAHDIKVPMNNIMGMVTLANQYLDDRERLTSYLNKIMLSSEYLVQLLNDVLDMSLIESGRVTLANDEINIYDFIDGICDIVNPQLEAHNQTLNIIFSNIAHPFVTTDSLKLQQCFLNFLSNSIKYTSNGGEISIKIIESDLAVQSTASYTFIFEDNGCGIGTDFISHIFEPFVRENVPAVKQMPGSGLGMTIAYNIVDLLGGSINVWSRHNIGSRFTVRLSFKLHN